MNSTEARIKKMEKFFGKKIQEKFLANYEREFHRKMMQKARQVAPHLFREEDERLRRSQEAAIEEAGGVPSLTRHYTPGNDSKYKMRCKETRVFTPQTMLREPII